MSMDKLDQLGSHVAFRFNERTMKHFPFVCE